VPTDYPTGGDFSIECKTYSKLTKKVNKYAKSRKLTATKLFQVIANTIMDLGLLGGDDDEGFVGIADNADNEYEEPEEPVQPSTEKKRKNVG